MDKQAVLILQNYVVKMFLLILKIKITIVHHASQQIFEIGDKIQQIPSGLTGGSVPVDERRKKSKSWNEISIKIIECFFKTIFHISPVFKGSNNRSHTNSLSQSPKSNMPQFADGFNIMNGLFYHRLNESINKSETI